MRLLLFSLILFLFSCGDDSVVTPIVVDDAKIVSTIPSGDIYVDRSGTDTLYLVLTSTIPLRQTSLSHSFVLGSEDSLLTDELLKSWIVVSLPDLTLLYQDNVYDDTIAVPVRVTEIAQQTLGREPYLLKFTHHFGTEVYSRSIRFHVAPFIAIRDLTPVKDTLDTLLLPDLDTFTFTLDANKLVSPEDVSFSFKKPNGYDASAFLSAQLLPFVPAESVLCTALVSLVSNVDVQGEYEMIVSAINESAVAMDTAVIEIDGPDVIEISDLLLEADSVSPGGQLEGFFSYSANRLMSRSDVSFAFSDLALNPVSSISGYAHTFTSFFSGTCEYDINVGASTPVGSYIYNIIMTNDSLSDTLSGTMHVAEGVVEQLKIVSVTPNPLTMYKNYGQMKATFLMTSSKWITTQNSYYDLVDTSDSSVLHLLQSDIEYIEEENGLYKSTLLLKPQDTLSEGQYYLRYGCALDSVGDTVSVSVTVEPFSVEIGDIPDQTISRGETVELSVNFSGSAVFTLDEFFSEVTSAPNCSPKVTFLSYNNGLLTFSVSVPAEALVSDAYVKVGIDTYYESFKVSIVEP